MTTTFRTVYLSITKPSPYNGLDKPLVQITDDLDCLNCEAWQVRKWHGQTDGDIRKAVKSFTKEGYEVDVSVSGLEV